MIPALMTKEKYIEALTEEERTALTYVGVFRRNGAQYSCHSYEVVRGIAIGLPVPTGIVVAAAIETPSAIKPDVWDKYPEVRKALENKYGADVVAQSIQKWIERGKEPTTESYVKTRDAVLGIFKANNIPIPECVLTQYPEPVNREVTA